MVARQMVARDVSVREGGHADALRPPNPELWCTSVLFPMPEGPTTAVTSPL